MKKMLSLILIVPAFEFIWSTTLFADCLHAAKLQAIEEARILVENDMANSNGSNAGPLKMKWMLPDDKLKSQMELTNPYQ